MKNSMLLLILLSTLCVFLSACGSGNSAPPPLPTVTISASASAVNVGHSLTLNWSSTNATSCSASATPSESDWSGTQKTGGSSAVTPAAAGPVTYSLNCTGMGGSASGSANITAKLLLITSASPPSGTAGVLYNHPSCPYPGEGCYFPIRLMASGGRLSYHWTWAAAPGSSLPPGLAIETIRNPVLGDTTGITGIPAQAGTFDVVVTVTDSSSTPNQDSATYTIVFSSPPPPTINTTPSPAIGTLNSPYVGYTFAGTNGLGPLTWSETGALPPGMALSPDGALSGVPTAAGSFPIAVSVEDSAGQKGGPQNFTIQVFSTGFSRTGNMKTPRWSHTATLLSDKTVLIVGVSDNIPSAAAELFDPATGMFSSTGSMATARFSLTATLLCDLSVSTCNDKKVLVAGGGTATAELFDPASGTFASTGSMVTARRLHTATLLPNGKVLVIGGQDTSGNPLATAELFDPSNESFAPTGDLGMARTSHTATLLANGKVLVIGGAGSGPDLATAELYDPFTGTFAPTGSMEDARSGHTATLLKNGKVLITGGSNSGIGLLGSAELYDPSTGTFSRAGQLGTARDGHTATLLVDGTVLVAGGSSGNVDLSSAELFNPANGTFAPAADMTTPRASHAAILLSDGKVLVTGGLASADTSSAMATAELYQ